MQKLMDFDKVELTEDIFENLKSKTSALETL